jgi:hypothetical protein
LHQNPYLLNAGTTAYNSGISVTKPIAERTALPPPSWDYMLWTDIFVAPIITNTTTRHVQFPAGNNWVDWWNNSIIYQGNTSITYSVPLEIFPVFMRQGAMLPLQVNNSLVNHGDEFSADYITMLVVAPIVSTDNTDIDNAVGAQGYAAIREFRKPSQELRYFTHHDQEQQQLVFSFVGTAHTRKLIVLIRTATLESQLAAVNVDKVLVIVDRLTQRVLRKVDQWGAFSKGCTAGCWYANAAANELWFKPFSGLYGVHVDVISAA